MLGVEGTYIIGSGREQELLAHCLLIRKTLASPYHMQVIWIKGLNKKNENSIIFY